MDTHGTPSTGTANELSGIVLGPSVQAGAIHGDVHVGQQWDVPPPRQVPPPSPRFTGRVPELAELDEVASAGTAVVLLTGPGGVGKTALALFWAYRVAERYWDGHLYVNLGGFSGTNLVGAGEALGGFLRALGVAPQRVPGSVAEMAALYRSVTAGRALLVVIDDASSVTQIRPLLPASGPAVVVVTSRNRLTGLVADGAHSVDVGPLPAGDSLVLLGKTVGGGRIDKEPEDARAITGMCGGLPIALCVAGARLATRPLVSLRRMAAELSDEATRLSRLSTPDGLSVRAAFDVSYRHLPPRAAALYRRMTAHPGPEMSAGPIAALLALDGPNGPDGVASSEALEMLLEANLVQETGEDRYGLHDLLRLHASRKAEAEDGAQARDAALLAVAEWYFLAARRADEAVTPYRTRLPYQPAKEPTSLPVFAGRKSALDWLERERLNLLAVGRATLAAHPELCWHLSDVLWPIFLYHKHYHDRMDVDRRGLDAARAWGNGWAEAVMLKRLSRNHAASGDRAAAEEVMTAAIRRFEESGDPHRAWDAREGLAALYRDSGRSEPAADLFAQALAANRELADKRRLGLSLINLGRLLPVLGRAEEAVKLLREADEVFAGLADVDPFNGARVLIGLADAYLSLGDLDRAESAAVDAVRRMRELGSAGDEAEAVGVLAMVAGRRGDVAGARSHYRRAYELLQELGSPRAEDLRRKLDDLSTVDS